MTAWKHAKLGEVVEVNPPLPSKPHPQELVSVVPMASVGAGTNTVQYSASERFSDVKSGLRPFVERDVLLAKITPSMENGKAAVVQGLPTTAGFGSTELHVLRCGGSIKPEYLYYFLGQTTFRSVAKRSMTGTAGQLRVPTKWLRDVEVPLPPLSIQESIVEEIEKQFTRLGAASSSLQRARMHLQSYRSAVIAAACSGRLIVNPESWQKRKLDELGSVNRGVSKHRPRNDPLLYKGNYPFIQTGDVRRSNVFIKSFSQTYSDAGLAQSKLWPEGTLCITIAANIAETGILKFPACFPDSVVGFQASPSSLVRWVELFFRANQSRLSEAAPATAQKNINLAVLRNLVVPVPSDEERELIIEEVDRRLSVVDDLEASLGSQLQRATALWQSLLGQAFSGRLTSDVSR